MKLNIKKMLTVAVASTALLAAGCGGGGNKDPGAREEGGGGRRAAGLRSGEPHRRHEGARDDVREGSLEREARL